MDREAIERFLSDNQQLSTWGPSSTQRQMIEDLHALFADGTLSHKEGDKIELTKHLLNFLKPIYALHVANKPNSEFQHLLYNKQNIVDIVPSFESQSSTAQSLVSVLAEVVAIQQYVSFYDHPLPTQLLTTLLSALKQKNHFTADILISDIAGGEEKKGESVEQNYSYLKAQIENEISLNRRNYTAQREMYSLERYQPARTTTDASPYTQLPYMHQATINSVFLALLKRHQLSLSDLCDSASLCADETDPMLRPFTKPSEESLAWLREFSPRYFVTCSTPTLLPFHFYFIQDVYKHLKSEFTNPQNQTYLAEKYNQIKQRFERQKYNADQVTRLTLATFFQEVIADTTTSFQQRFSPLFGGWLPIIINPMQLLSHQPAANQHKLIEQLNVGTLNSVKNLIASFQDLLALLPNCSAELLSDNELHDILEPNYHSPHCNYYDLKIRWERRSANSNKTSLFSFKNAIEYTYQLDRYGAGIDVTLNQQKVGEATNHVYRQALTLFLPTAPLHRSYFPLDIWVNLTKDEKQQLISQLSSNSVPAIVNNDRPVAENPLYEPLNNPINANMGQRVRRMRASDRCEMFKILFLACLPRHRQWFSRFRLVSAIHYQAQKDSLPRYLKGAFSCLHPFWSPPTAVLRAVTFFGLFLFSYNIPVVQIEEDFYYKLGPYFNFLSLGSASIAMAFFLGLPLMKGIFNVCYDRVKIKSPNSNEGLPSYIHWPAVDESKLLPSSELKNRVFHQPFHYAAPAVNQPILNQHRKNIFQRYFIEGLVKTLLLPAYRMTWAALWGAAYYATVYSYINSQVIPPSCQTWFSEHHCAPVFKSGNPICDNLPTDPASFCDVSARFGFAALAIGAALTINVLRFIPFLFVIVHHLAQRFDFISRAYHFFKNGSACCQQQPEYEPILDVELTESKKNQ